MDAGGPTPPARRSIEDLSAELQIDLRHIPVDDIDPTPGNPNVLTDEIRDALSSELDRGFVQPIVVRPEGDRWRLIDGEHRWELVREKGYKAIPAVVTDDDETEGRIRLLTINRLRGQFVPIQLAYFLADLAKTVPEDELRKRLGMEASEFRDSLALATFTDPIDVAVRAAREQEEREAPVVLHFALSQRDAKVVEEAVATLVSSSVDRGRALAKICRDHKSKTKAKT